MSRPNQINFVQAVYEYDPYISDAKMRAFVYFMFNEEAQVLGVCPNPHPTLKTLSVWKAKLRKKGVFIPDLRKENKNRGKTI